MADYFEIDFLDVETAKSGDAICIRYEVQGRAFIHVVDGGYQDTGDKIIEHLTKHYGNPARIDHVVVTHNDNDHAGGLRVVLEKYQIGALWMLRPWLYAPEIIHRFANYTNVDNLKSHLREVYSNLVALEEIATRKRIPILEPFQGTSIGMFHVMAPTKQRFLNLIVTSDRTAAAKLDEQRPKSLGQILFEAASKAVKLVKAAWGVEVFPDEGTSAENEMSVIQFAVLAGQKILLTGDAGREGLSEVITYSPHIGLALPGIDRFQVPHHGSRRNVSTQLLDQLLGPRLIGPTTATKFIAIISSAKEDANHPRKSVIRAMLHRGAFVCTTEGRSIRTQQNALPRDGWTALTQLPYPADQEE